MHKFRASNNNYKKMNGIVKLKFVAKKLQKSLSLKKKSSSNNYFDDVPKDVKEGHFAVKAVEGNEEPKRFVIPLSYLANPNFLRLLELAAEEYGFDIEGALQIPCSPSHLETVLSEDESS